MWTSMSIVPAVADIHTKRGDWEDVVHYRRLQPCCPIDRTDMTIAVADLLGEKLNNVRGALEIYQELLDKEPGSKMVLGKMLGMHEASGNWESAVDILTQLADLEDNSSRKAKYWVGVATIQHKKLDDRFLAVRSFDNALDADPAMLQAFQAIDRILTEEKDYERQDHYRKMLKRAMENQMDDDLVFKLAKNLEINRSRLKKFEAAKAYRSHLRRPNDPHITDPHCMS